MYSEMRIILVLK